MVQYETKPVPGAGEGEDTHPAGSHDVQHQEDGQTIMGDTRNTSANIGGGGQITGEKENRGVIYALKTVRTTEY